MASKAAKLGEEHSSVTRYRPGKAVEAIVYRCLRSVRASLSAKGEKSSTPLMASKVLMTLASKLEEERKLILGNVEDCRFMNFPVEAQLLANEIVSIRSCDHTCITAVLGMLKSVSEESTARNYLERKAKATQLPVLKDIEACL